MNSQEHLALMAKFDASEINKLPKPTQKQTQEVKNNYQAGIRCGECGGWHHPKVVHLDYVGHAALTKRLLNVDPEWFWQPVSVDENDQPLFDKTGGLWIELTICGVTRLGYGDAPGKSGGNAIKEIIGDALRNAAMRFGVALDLWSKSELHQEEDEPTKKMITIDQKAELRTLLGQTSTSEKDFEKFLSRELKAKSINELSAMGFSFAKNSLLDKVESLAKKKKQLDEVLVDFNIWLDTQIANIQEESKLTTLSLVYEGIKAELPKKTKQYGLNNADYEEKIKQTYIERKKQLTPEVKLVCTSCGNESLGAEGSLCTECKGQTIISKSNI